MIDATLEPDRAARWIVCESGNRWDTALRRFLPQLLPKERLPLLIKASVAEARSQLLIQGPKVILWEFDRDSLVKVCDCLIQGAKLAPDSLQLAACSGLSTRQQLTLAELPVAAILRHPEDLPRLKPMVQGYFARHRQVLD